jgi:hypothetical protein
LSFVGGCLLATLICIGNILYYDVFIQSTTTLSFESFDRERFSSFIPLHPPYFSLYITFCIVIAGSLLIKNWIESSVITKSMLTGLILYLFVINLLLSSRMPLIFLALIFCVWLIRHIHNHPISGSFIAVVILAIIIFLFNSYSLLQDRFREITETDWSPPVGNYHNSTNMRVGIFLCTTSLLKENWVFGVGTGDTQEKLNSCYQRNGYSDVLYNLEYNTHNEYFNIWLTTGIGGLFIFVLSLFIPLNMAYKRKFYLYLAFLALIILFCVTESLLERQKGIVFYGFFNSIFAFHFKELRLGSKISL